MDKQLRERALMALAEIDSVRLALRLEEKDKDEPDVLILRVPEQNAEAVEKFYCSLLSAPASGPRMSFGESFIAARAQEEVVNGFREGANAVGPGTCILKPFAAHQIALRLFDTDGRIWMRTSDAALVEAVMQILLAVCYGANEVIQEEAQTDADGVDQAPEPGDEILFQPIT